MARSGGAHQRLRSARGAGRRGAAQPAAGRAARRRTPRRAARVHRDVGRFADPGPARGLLSGRLRGLDTATAAGTRGGRRDRGHRGCWDRRPAPAVRLPHRPTQGLLLLLDRGPHGPALLQSGTPGHSNRPEPRIRVRIAWARCTCHRQRLHQRRHHPHRGGARPRRRRGRPRREPPAAPRPSTASGLTETEHCQAGNSGQRRLSADSPHQRDPIATAGRSTSPRSRSLSAASACSRSRNPAFSSSSSASRSSRPSTRRTPRPATATDIRPEGYNHPSPSSIRYLKTVKLDVVRPGLSRHDGAMDAALPRDLVRPRHLAATRVLDWHACEVQAFLGAVRQQQPVDTRALLQATHGMIVARIRPVYALDDTQPASRTLALGRGSCSQRLAVLEAVARASGVPTRVRGLEVAGSFWYPRFRRLRLLIPKRVVLAWPQFHFSTGWVDVAELFGSLDDLASRCPTGFANVGEKTLFEAVTTTAVDWSGHTRELSACRQCDLSGYVLNDLGVFDARDELFATVGQTLCLPARLLADPVLARHAAS